MNQRFTKFASPLISLVLLFSAVAFTPPARAADSFVYTDFAANDFGLWSQSSIYGQEKKAVRNSKIGSSFGALAGMIQVVAFTTIYLRI